MEPLSESLVVPETEKALAPTFSPKVTKAETRTSLEVSTLDGVYATIFTSVTTGVLLTNFLVELKATPIQMGMLASIPMLGNLLQPLGAYFADRTSSRFKYSMKIYLPARLLWLLVVGAIIWLSWRHLDSHFLINLVLVIVFLSNFLGALGSASWLSWLASLVPRRLRGRYFGFRSRAANLTSMICVPLIGLGVSYWPGGTIQGYGVFLMVGISAGVISLGYQFFMRDINPQTLKKKKDQLIPSLAIDGILTDEDSISLWQDKNFIIFLIYFSLWMFAINLSSPFFNIYMLDALKLNVSWVTLYNSLSAATNLLVLVRWGKLADRIGNRPILLLIGVIVALTPLLWLGVGADSLSIFLWLPLLHILMSGTWVAIDLCCNNLQLGIAKVENCSVYFATAAAVAGVSGALGTTAGGFLAQFSHLGGFLGLFVLSSLLRLVALLPLVFVQEKNSHSVSQLLKKWLQTAKI
nr:MFS transporter [Gloeothece citriformis]